MSYGAQLFNRLSICAVCVVIALHGPILLVYQRSTPAAAILIPDSELCSMSFRQPDVTSWSLFMYYHLLFSVLPSFVSAFFYHLSLTHYGQLAITFKDVRTDLDKTKTRAVNSSSKTWHALSSAA
jgi:hypothetical protein